MQALRAYERHRPAEQFGAGDPRDEGVGIGKVRADVAESRGAEERVGDGVTHDVSVRMSRDARFGLEHDATQGQRTRGVAWMHVEAETDPGASTTPGSRPSSCPTRARVKVQACGVCHTDLHYREGAINDEFPFLLGHEAAGLVEAVGEGVTNVAPGDYVVLAWRAPCGTCRSCRRGRPWYCFDSLNATQKMTLDGQDLSPGPGHRRLRREDPRGRRPVRARRPRARPEAAGLIGCGVMAGFGRGHATPATCSGATPWPSSAAAGVGDAAIAGARLAGARTIIAVDLDPRKLEWAKGFGATHTVDASKEDPVEARQGAAPTGFGADVVIEAVGHPEVMEQAFFSRDLAGTLVQVGVPVTHDDDRRPADDRVLRPGRRPQAELVRRLPAQPATSPC